jgi:hypothetical protein
MQAFAGDSDNDDLSDGVRGSYSIISIRGSKWRIKHDGDEELVVNTEGDPLPTLKVVIVKSNKAVSKNFYKGGWEDGSSDAPVCFSMDGVRPDPSSEELQSTTCAKCPQNIFGSKITDTGKKAKACADSRRIAVVPEGDFANEVYGGPMLLRIPAGSLTNLAKYGKKMKQRGFPYNTIITRISFDPETSHPKLDFNAIRPLIDEEAVELAGMLGDATFNDKISNILAADVPLAQPAQAENGNDKLFEDEEAAPSKGLSVAPATPEAAPAEPAKAVEASAPPAQSEPVPIVEEDEPGDELDESLKGILDSLDSLD